MAAVCYVNLNPVRARLVSRAEDWPWSSARAHLAGVDDNLVIVRPVLDRTSCFADLLLQDRAEDFAALRRSEGIGRPIGTAEFVTGLERLLGRPIARQSPGPKPSKPCRRRAARIAAIGIMSTYLRRRIYALEHKGATHGKFIKGPRLRVTACVRSAIWLLESWRRNSSEVTARSVTRSACECGRSLAEHLRYLKMPFDNNKVTERTYPIGIAFVIAHYDCA